MLTCTRAALFAAPRGLSRTPTLAYRARLLTARPPRAWLRCRAAAAGQQPALSNAERKARRAEAQRLGKRICTVNIGGCCGEVGAQACSLCMKASTRRAGGV